MAVINPFKGVLYDPQKVDPSKIMAPPYDVITPAFKNELYSRSPNNIVRVDFGKDSDDDNEDTNRYTRAANDISDWLTQGILTAEKDPCYYLYEIRYELEGQTLRTRGFLGAVKLEEISKGSIHPHEETYSKPKSDRLNIMRYCQANTSPIFSLFSSHKTGISEVMDRIAADKPYISAVDEDGSIHTLWKITGQDDMEIIRAEMSDRDIFIADGHHRYETALAFQKEMAEAGKNLTGD
ncbi:DUF1015 domain-containing protein [bacterium]|nr:DUF1015 domain-containing protein [bacterium]